MLLLCYRCCFGFSSSINYKHSHQSSLTTHIEKPKKKKQKTPMASPFLFSLFLLLSLLISTCSTTITTTITIRLSRFTNEHHSTDSSSLVTSTLARAQHLKNPKTKTNSSSLVKTPLFPRSYGEYSISLGFGTPPQTIPFIMDTGSSLVWFPCTSSYLCYACNVPNTDQSNIPSFIPKNSSSSKLLGCKNPLCSLRFGPDVKSECQDDCDSTTPNCTQPCPIYREVYGSGLTVGYLLVETLDFPLKKVPDFVVGCSIFSIQQPSAGIAGFGRGPESLPSQMGLKKFSYCLVSHKFDDAPVSSEMVLYTGSDHAKTRGVSYTPFYKNPVGSNVAFQQYYYVLVRKIIVGDKDVEIPYSYLVPGSDGNGGTIVDSGTTLTYMERPVYELVAHEFEKQMSNYSRAAFAEDLSGLRPCFIISGKKSEFAPPGLIFQFKGGAKMALANSFLPIGIVDVVCLTIMSDDDGFGGGMSTGPAIILGNYQQQNYYVEFDLENDRFGFRRQRCT